MKIETKIRRNKTDMWELQIFISNPGEEQLHKHCSFIFETEQAAREGRALLMSVSS